METTPVADHVIAHLTIYSLLAANGIPVDVIPSTVTLIVEELSALK
jgi:hypothetical protein